jgi:predicted ester cyclase
MGNRPRTSLDAFHASKTAQHADELVRAFFAAVNAEDNASIDAVLTRNFQSYSIDGVWSRTGLKKYYADLRRSFTDLHYEVHENIGVLVENDLIALRTIITGKHTGEYAGVAATGKSIQTSTSHIFRFRDDQLVEHWQVTDTYRILVPLGVVPGVASSFQQAVGVPPSPNGIFAERLGTAFDAPRKGKPVTRDESRAVGRRLFDGVITTGKVEDVEALAKTYIQNTGWTPDGSSVFGHAWAMVSANSRTG